MFIFTIADIVVGVVVFAFVCVWIYHAAKQGLTQSKCKHDAGVTETQACDAVCKKCCKNLGFIGTQDNKIRRLQ